MASVMKPYILKQHDFYVQQTKLRILTQFHDLEGDADKHAKDEYNRLLSGPGDEYTDLESLYEAAHDNAIDYYGLLADLQQQVILGALGGLYHAWEKELRDFIERELQHYYIKIDASKLAWSSPVTDIFDLLAKFGWNLRNETFFSLVDASRLIVNVYKHGNGRSLEELKRDYPRYLPAPLNSTAAKLLFAEPDYTMLTVTEDHFVEIADALRAFWVTFPERLYHTVP